MKRLHVVVAWVAACWGAAASGCPVCDSATGREVRAGIVAGDFGSNLLAVVLPFAAVAAVAAAVHCGLSFRGASDGHHPDGNPER